MGDELARKESRDRVRSGYQTISEKNGGSKQKAHPGEIQWTGEEGLQPQPRAQGLAGGGG